MRFSWDPRKAAANLRKHRVSFPEAVTVFADPLAQITDDAIHGDRVVIVGQSAMQRILVTVFASILDEEIRIISARRATRTERRYYEQSEG